MTGSQSLLSTGPVVIGGGEIGGDYGAECGCLLMKLVVVMMIMVDGDNGVGDDGDEKQQGVKLSCLLSRWGIGDGDVSVGC